MKWIGLRKIKLLELSTSEKFEGPIDLKITDDGLLGLSENCNDLKSLHISECGNITDTGMIAIINKCNLQSLDIGWCESITDSSILQISNKCDQLQELNIASCNNITDTSLIEIGKNCIHLKSLNISSNNITDTSLIWLESH